MSATQTFDSFDQFYSFYLSEHSDRTCRRLHFIGSTLGLMFLATAIINGVWWFLIPAVLTGYAFAWVGHFFFEHNKPASFAYPWLSFKGDWRMYWDMLTGKISM